MLRDILSSAAEWLGRGRSFAVCLLLCALIASFAHQAIKGDHGLERRAQIKQRIADMKAEHGRLAAKRARLERDVDLMRVAEKRPTDLAETQVREVLNLARPGETIVIDAPYHAE